MAEHEKTENKADIKIEDKINSALNGDSLANALYFAAFLNESEFTLSHDGGDGWSVNRANENIAYVMINGNEEEPGPWTVWFHSCDFGDEIPNDNELKETAWAHASICGHFSTGGQMCGCGSQPGFTRTIFGKAFENRCNSPLMFTNPDAKTLQHIKRLMLMLA